jgi:hypothetical protein
MTVSNQHASPSVDADRWLSTPVGMALAGVLAAGTLVGLTSPGQDTGVEAAALILTLVYGIYVGFALTRGDLGALAIEIGFVLVGLVLIGLGLWRSPGWLAVGFALHGGWDLLHHRDRHVLGVRGVPVWYVPACAVYDWIVAAGVAVLIT